MAVSLVIGAAVYLYFKSLACGVTSFLAGVFVDIDHIIDYYLNYGQRADWKDFYRFCTEARLQKLTLVFHSYELLILLWVSIIVFSLGDIWKALAIGATQHVIFDQVSNIGRSQMDRRTYFLSFRLKKGFNKGKMRKQ